MPCGIGVAVHGGPLPSEPSRRTGVVEVNMGDEDFLDGGFIDSDRTDRRAQRLQRGARPGFDQRVIAPTLHKKSGDESRNALEEEIERVDAHGCSQ